MERLEFGAFTKALGHIRSGGRLRMLGAILSDVASFEEKKPVTVGVPSMTTQADLSEYGLGTVSITESGTTVTVRKL